MKRILIIEDDNVIAEVEKDYLEASGFQTDVAHSGDVGLQMALNGCYDLIILDLMLPQTDGFEICRQVRKASNVPILMVSAKKEDVDKIRGLGLGADDYVIKPFSLGELVARVKAHLARYERLVGSGETKKEEIRIRGIRIDVPARRVFVNETEVTFTSKEYDLLLFLVKHPGRVFTKDELFERIWGLDSLGDIATVTVHISKLREKIELNPSKPQYIETIWGVGYRFNM
ncbi:response regulator transcription factor [Brevibacillus sp. B_LB10_24]|uniref:response regulator transcription factor n=1 Tax=Brevibacillus sp. B_LB10_24 TaxID=3380645 RepID=UPI0038BC5252